MTTQNKNVPALRFTEFQDEWQTQKLEQISTKISDGIHSTPQYDESGEYYFVNGNNLVVGKVVVFENTKKVNEAEYLKHRKELNNKTILLSINGTIGSLALFNGEKIILGKSACYINLNGVADKMFIYNILQTPTVVNFFTSELTGSTIKNLSLATVKNCNLHLPTIIEQQKIAAFLTAVDEKIQQLTKKKDLLEQYKKGVMQQIFNQEIRFKDDNGNGFADWEEKKLGDVYNITSSKRVFESEWAKKGVPFYRAREIVKLNANGFVENELFISTEMYENYKAKYGAPQKNDLLVTGVGTIGKLYLVKDNERFYFKDGNIIWFKNLNLINSQFVKQLFNSRIIQKQIEDNASITTVGTYTIDSAKKTKIPFPSLLEQEKIANFLIAIDDKINLVKKQLEKTQAFKKGLLQQMFV